MPEGHTIHRLARDHKRLLDDDRGPNTGGMGAISPVPGMDDASAVQLVADFHQRALEALVGAGAPFRSALYAGLMLTHAGPCLLEFNARLGDPETQAILPRLAVPLAPLLLAAATDRLAGAMRSTGISGPTTVASERATAAVVIAGPGYPDRSRTGLPIEGIDAARREGCLVFGAGVARDAGGPLCTAGGRVVTVVGSGGTLDEAAARAYAAADHIHLEGRQLRRDIGRSAAAVGVAP